MGDEDDNTYKVKEDDTLYSIARDNGLSLEQLLEANPELDEKDILAIDQEIILPPKEYNTYKVGSGDNLTQIARDNGLSLKQLLEANPALDKNDTLKIGQEIILPPRGDDSSFSGDDEEDNTYKVQEDDTLTKIAHDNGLSLKQLLAMNPELNENTKLKIDQEIVLPSEGYNYVAVSGDNLTRIARDHGVRVEAVRAANLAWETNDNIHPGDKIHIPAQYYMYTVQSGDNLTKISKEQTDNHVSVHTLKLANPDISEQDAINVGDKIRIPTGYYMHNTLKGQSLADIKKTYNVSIKELKEANPVIPEDGTIQIGQHIRIPSPSVQLALMMESYKKIDSEVSGKPEKITEVFNKAVSPKAYNVSSEVTRRAWADAKAGITHDPVKSIPGSKPLIVIDLGHGSKNKGGVVDPGAVSKDQTLTEAEIVDAVGTSLVHQLEDAGYQVGFTRNPGEVFLYEGTKGARLNRRAIYATNLERELKAPYTMFVSLHVNSAEGDAGRGYEAKIPRAKDGAMFQKNSKQFATSVLENMGVYHPSIFRGIEEQSLQIFRDFSKDVYGSDAAVLVELDFLNNDSGQGRLESMRDKPYKIARGIVKGIDQYVQQQSPDLSMKDDVINNITSPKV